jgi:DNA adenine methylase
VPTVAGTQLDFFPTQPPKQLLKWIGSKHRFAPIIVPYLPVDFSRYIEPFVGGGAVLGTVAPKQGLAGDILEPLTQIWWKLQRDLDSLVRGYTERWEAYQRDSQGTYLGVRSGYNDQPNPDDLLFLSRSCYGGVIRFTKEGKISTPIGPHRPISPQSFHERAREWRFRVRGTSFVHADFEELMDKARHGDVVYCDPPYLYSQQILYGSQAFGLGRLWQAVARCKSRGANVLVSIDGFKKSGKLPCRIELPAGLFERELLLDAGRSMLRRFQKRGSHVADEGTHDRLLLTW